MLTVRTVQLLPNLKRLSSRACTRTAKHAYLEKWPIQMLICASGGMASGPIAVGVGRDYHARLLHLELDLADGSALQVPPIPLEGDLIAYPWLRHHAREVVRGHSDVGPVEGEVVQPRHRAAEGRARLHILRLPAVPLRRVVAITALRHGKVHRLAVRQPQLLEEDLDVTFEILRPRNFRVLTLVLFFSS